MSEASPQQILELVDTVIRAAGTLTRVGDTIAAVHHQSAARSLILGALDGQPRSIAEVARLRGLRRQSVQEVMGRLEADNLVARDETANRRSPTFRLTPEGDRARSGTHQAFLEWASGLRNLESHEVAIASGVLQRLTRMSGAH